MKSKMRALKSTAWGFQHILEALQHCTIFMSPSFNTPPGQASKTLGVHHVICANSLESLCKYQEYGTSYIMDVKHKYYLCITALCHETDIIKTRGEDCKPSYLNYKQTEQGTGTQNTQISDNSQ